MTCATTDHDHLHHDDGSTTTPGFRICLTGDCLIFAVLFAIFGALAPDTAGGADLFRLSFVLGATALLLLSSYTFGIAVLEAQARHQQAAIRWLAATFVLGAAFIVIEVAELRELLHEGAGPNGSAFLSSCFTLVGAHGLHVFCGLLWLAVLIHRIDKPGFDAMTRRSFACLSVFWYFLGLVWICVFSFVYLKEFV